MDRIRQIEYLETLVALRGQAATYHHHKEQMAFAGTVVYITACMTFVTNPSQLHQRIHTLDWAAYLVMLALSSIAFVAWQLWNRETARKLVKTLEAEIADNLTGDQSDVAEKVKAREKRILLSLSPTRCEKGAAMIIGNFLVIFMMAFSTLLAALAFRKNLP